MQFFTPLCDVFLLIRVVALIFAIVSVYSDREKWMGLKIAWNFCDAILTGGAREDPSNLRGKSEVGKKSEAVTTHRAL